MTKQYEVSKGAITRFRKNARARARKKAKLNNMKTSEFLDFKKLDYDLGVRRHFLSSEDVNNLCKESIAKMAVRKLKQKRKSLGWKQSDLAARSGIPQSTISRIECGTWNVSLKKLMKLAKAMGCMIDIELIDLPSSTSFA